MAHPNPGHVREVRGRGQEALGHAERSLRLYGTAGDRPGKANALNAVGWPGRGDPARVTRWRDAPGGRVSPPPTGAILFSGSRLYV